MYPFSGGCIWTRFDAGRARPKTPKHQVIFKCISKQRQDKHQLDEQAKLPQSQCHSRSVAVPLVVALEYVDCLVTRAVVILRNPSLGDVDDENP